jgi:hypothetical protein
MCIKVLNIMSVYITFFMSTDGFKIFFDAFF